MTMSISPAPDATAWAASWALTVDTCLPDGKPATAATRTPPAPDRDRDHRRRDAHRVDAQLGGLGDQSDHVGVGGLGFEQRVVDQCGHLRAGGLARH